MTDRNDWMLLLQKKNVELYDIDSDNENDTDSSRSLYDFGSESDSSDPDIYSRSIIFFKQC